MFINFRTTLKKIIPALIAVAIFMLIFTPSKLISASADGVAEFAVELESGQILHEKNSHAKLPMASTTKIMTAYIIATECDLDEVITVDDLAVGTEGSSIYLKHGERISVKDLLYGLMLRSGNDAACALAIHHSGSIEKFVDKMNETAKELSAFDTNFKNPNGLPAEGHYTTAADLAKISCAAIKNKTFAEVVATKHYTGQFRCFTNKNKLLAKFEGANGIKTGYTEKAGRCLVSSAKRDNMDVVCVVLNCYDMYERSEKILQSCFDGFSAEIIPSDRIFYYDSIPCHLRKNERVVVPRGAELSYVIVGADDPNGGDAFAKLEIYNENNLIFCENLYTIN